MSRGKRWAFNIWNRELGVDGRVDRIQNPMHGGSGAGGIGDGFVNLLLRPVTVPISLPFKGIGKLAGAFLDFQDTILIFHPDHLDVVESSEVLAVVDENDVPRLPRLKCKNYHVDTTPLTALGITNAGLSQLEVRDFFDGARAGRVQVLMRGVIHRESEVPANRKRWVTWHDLMWGDHPEGAFHEQIYQAVLRRGQSIRGVLRLLENWHGTKFNVTIETPTT